MSFQEHVYVTILLAANRLNNLTAPYWSVTGDIVRSTKFIQRIERFTGFNADSRQKTFMSLNRTYHGVTPATAILSQVPVVCPQSSTSRIVVSDIGSMGPTRKHTQPSRNLTSMAELYHRFNSGKG